MKPTLTNSSHNATSPCPCCGEFDAKIISTIDGKTGESLTTISCGGCGLGRIDPFPTDAELEAWYARQYRQAYKGCETPAMRYVLRAARNAKERLEWLKLQGLLSSSTEKLNTLDIGASSGEFVFLMSHNQYNAFGIEPHQGYAEYAQSMNLNVRNGSLLRSLDHFDKKNFDLITMFHVLEHLADPVGSLKSIGETLKNSGTLYIEVPNATRLGSPRYMFFRAHTLYFTHASLRHLLACSGFEILAQNDPDSDNLRVLARHTGVQLSTRRLAHQHELVAAQLKRKWVPYLCKQLFTGKPFFKIIKRIREKSAAKKYSASIELMKDIYSA